MGDLVCKIVNDSGESFFVADDGCDFELSESPVVVRTDSGKHNSLNIYDLGVMMKHEKILGNGVGPDGKYSHLVCLAQNDAELILSPNDNPFYVKCPKCYRQYLIDNKMLEGVR